MRITRFSLISLLSVSTCFADFADTRTVDDALREHPEILVNSQGVAQHDLSIRGSSYAGTGISLNGLNLKSPYSAHFNADLPFLSYLFSEPTASYGLNNVSGHLIGTAAYSTIPQSERLQLHGGFGSDRYYRSALMGGTEQVGGFVDREKASGVDLDSNDMDRFAAGAYAHFFYDDWAFSLLGGHQHKIFGTEGYYGNPVFTEQIVDDSIVQLSAMKGDLDGAFIRAGAAFRAIKVDDSNARYGTAMIEGRTLEIQDFALNLRLDAENEFAKGQDRTRSSLLILPEVRLKQFTIKAGVNAVFQTAESGDFLPQAGMDWFLTDNSRLYASYSETIQQPDFQTLESNPRLAQQKAAHSEIGLHQFLSEHMDWRMAGFHRKLKHASDWIGGSAMDLGSLNVSGLDASFNWYPSENVKLRAFYQWAHKDNSTANGLYETDYPEHLLSLSGFWRFMPEWMLFGSQNLRYQAENTLRSGNDFGANASLGLHYAPEFAQNMRLSFLVENLWNSDFQTVPGVKARPTTVSTGITVVW